MNYEDLKQGDRVELETIVNHGTMAEVLKWIPGTIYFSEGFFKKRVKLDNGTNEPIIPHRMQYVRTYR